MAHAHAPSELRRICCGCANHALAPMRPMLRRRYHLAVTVRKDTEWTSSFDNDYLWMYDPVLKFDSYFDNESVNGTGVSA